MNKKYKGSITIEMSLIFPVILVVILTVCILALYLSDVVCLRAYMQTFALLDIADNKSEDVLEQELIEKLMDCTYIIKITNISINKKQEVIKVDYKLDSTFVNIKIKNSCKVEFHCENNREYIVRTKTLIDSIKQVED